VKIEKRKTPRVPIAMNIEQFDAVETYGFGYAKNISEEGLAIEAQALIDPEKLPKVGDELRLRFKLPHSRLVITVQGKVMRIDPGSKTPCLAIAFHQLSPDFHREIQRYVTAVRQN